MNFKNRIFAIVMYNKHLLTSCLGQKKHCAIVRLINTVIAIVISVKFSGILSITSFEITLFFFYYRTAGLTKTVS